VGGTIGGLLLESGFSTEFVSRGPHGRAIRQEGLRIRFPDREITVHAPCFESVDEVVWRPGDMALLATRLRDARQAMQQIPEARAFHIPVVCATSGMHAEQWARARFPLVLSMLVWLPVSHLRPGEVSVYAAECPGVLDTGPGHPGSRIELALATSLCRRLSKAGLDAVPRADIQRWKLARWITSLGSAAEAFVTDDWKTVAELARAEGEAVLDAAGVDRVTTAELQRRCQHVQPGLIDGRPRPGGPAWQSLHRGKPLESPWIEGAMARLGSKLGVPAPINRFLTNASKSPRPLLARQLLAAAGVSRTDGSGPPA
jgi:ketopantoate reductase